MASKEKKKRTLKREALEIIVAFLVAWLAYQTLAAVSGTSLPIVSVVSDSMYHTSHFDQWWNANGQFYPQYGIGKAQFRTFIDANGLSRGDLLIVAKATNLRPGDILIYRKFGSDFTIVHRLVTEENGFYIVKGDNNQVADPPVEKQFVVGKVIFAVPVLGYPRLILHLVGI